MVLKLGTTNSDKTNMRRFTANNSIPDEGELMSSGWVAAAAAAAA